MGFPLGAALDAFYREHRRCGELDGGVEGDSVWMKVFPTNGG